MTLPSPAKNGLLSGQTPLTGGFAPITDAEFARFQRLVLQETGITLSDQKRALVVSRLGSRLYHRKVGSFSVYYKIRLNAGSWNVRLLGFAGTVGSARITNNSASSSNP